MPGLPFFPRSPVLGLVACGSLVFGLLACGLSGCGDGSSKSGDSTASSSVSSLKSTDSRSSSATATRDLERQKPNAGADSLPLRPHAADASEIHDDRFDVGQGGARGDAETPVAISSDNEKPLPVFRPADVRPRHDDARLARSGIHRYESKRLVLYTDIAPETARRLPPVIDRAYDAWSAYFGELPRDRAGSDWQITGYLIGDRGRFERAGLVPRDLPPFINGRHRGREFWMYEQKEDYYRRHLLIHESTHCFMTTMPDVVCPLWYLEGMAELFGTHRMEEDGTIRFRVMPRDERNFGGLGRIPLVRADVAKEGYHTLEQLAALQPNDFLEDATYAWSWAACAFFDGHPRYADRFRDLGRRLGTERFDTMFRRAFAKDAAEIASGWAVFATNLDDGYDLKRAAIDFRPGTPIEPNEAPRACEVRADRGWQSSGVKVEAGRAYEIVATGRFTVAQQPKPWTSEAAGISFRYFDGRPLGELQATVRAAATSSDQDDDSMLKDTPLGANARFTAPWTGTLYFRLNDSWAELADNTGTVRVEIRPMKIADR